MVHGRTGTIVGRSAERPTRSSTGNGRIVKEEEDIKLKECQVRFKGTNEAVCLAGT